MTAPSFSRRSLVIPTIVAMFVVGCSSSASPPTPEADSGEAADTAAIDTASPDTLPSAADTSPAEDGGSDTSPASDSATTADTTASSDSGGTDVAVTDSAGPTDAGADSAPLGIGGAWTAQDSNTTQTLRAVWGSDATHVWAVGGGGTAVFYNGSMWQVRSSGTTEYITSIHGTSASTIYATTSNKLLKFNGTSWTASDPTGLGANQYLRCVHAIDATNAIVAIQGREFTGGTTFQARLRLSRISGTAITDIKSVDIPGYSVTYRFCQIASLGPDKYAIALRDESTGTDAGGTVLLWDGTNLTSKMVYTAPSLYFAAPTKIFVAGGSGMVLWPGGDTFDNLTTGYVGDHIGVSGTSATRVFALGNPYGSSGTPSVMYYDGLGWVTQTLPGAASTLRMSAIWAAPSGEVFAVGESGKVYRKGL